MINFLFTKTPLLFLVQSFWRDEAFTYLLAKRNILEILILTARDFNPPLYYLVIHYWIKLFGGSEIALRSFSFLMYWATIYVVYLFLTEILKIKFKKSLLYLVFFIINPALIYYAFEARMYTVLAFLASLSFYSFYKKRSFLYILSTTAGIYTHYFMIFVIIAQIIFSRKLLKTIILPLILFVPWTIFTILKKGIGNQSFWIEKLDLNTFVGLPGIIYTGYEKNFRFYEKYLLGFSLALLFLFMFTLLRINKERTENKRLFIFLTLWGLFIPFIIAIISYIKPVFLPRYFIFSTIGFLILFVFILERLRKIFRGIIFSTLIAVTILAITISYQQIQVINRQKANLRAVIGEIKKLAKKDDVLYVTSELDFFVAQYYFDENRVFIYGKTYKEIPNYVGKVLIPKDKVVNTLPKYPKKAFILTSNTHYDIQATF